METTSSYHAAGILKQTWRKSPAVLHGIIFDVKNFFTSITLNKLFRLLLAKGLLDENERVQKIV